MDIQSLSDSLETLLKASDSWLSAEHAPIVASLRVMARTLDVQDGSEDGITPSLMSQYNMTLARLAKMRPAQKPEKPKLEKLLTTARGEPEATTDGA